MYIDIKDICFKYDKNGDYVLKGFNLTAEKGSIVAILGESGCGKSTILRIIAGLEDPEKGTIHIDDKTFLDDTTNIRVEKRGIGMVFQDYALFPHLTVEHNISFGLFNKTKEEKNGIVSNMLDIIRMSEYRRKYPHELSGGQQQRIAIARALAPSPSILLMDEPFSNLDANLKDNIRTDIKEMLLKLNMTAIFVTHDEKDAKQIADQIVRVEKAT